MSSILKIREKAYTIIGLGVRGSIGFGSVDSDFWIFGVMFISFIHVLLIIWPGSVWFEL